MAIHRRPPNVSIDAPRTIGLPKALMTSERSEWGGPPRFRSGIGGGILQESRCSNSGVGGYLRRPRVCLVPVLEEGRILFLAAERAGGEEDKPQYCEQESKIELGNMGRAADFVTSLPVVPPKGER
jgi:hypothetical protein